MPIRARKRASVEPIMSRGTVVPPGSASSRTAANQRRASVGPGFRPTALGGRLLRGRDERLRQPAQIALAEPRDVAVFVREQVVREGGVERRQPRWSYKIMSHFDGLK